MLIGRIFGWILVALALVALGGDLLHIVAEGEVRLTSLGAAWYRLHVPSLNLAQAVVQRFLHPAIWDPGIQTVLSWPAVFVLGVPGLLMLALFRRRPPKRRSMFGDR